MSKLLFIYFEIPASELSVFIACHLYFFLGAGACCVSSPYFLPYHNESFMKAGNISLFSTRSDSQSVSCSVLSDFLKHYGLQPARFLCPKNSGMDCRFLLQRIFLTQGLNTGLLHCRQILDHLSHQGMTDC